MRLATFDGNPGIMPVFRRCGQRQWYIGVMTDLSSPAQLKSLVPALIALCEKAGETICEHYHAPDADLFEAKGDDSPLTRADLASDTVLTEGLARLEPLLPILSEESAPQDPAIRRAWPRYWLVDPLDGTKEFLARTGEFTINIALIDQHRATLGILYLPLEKVAYIGIPGLGAWRSGQPVENGLVNRVENHTESWDTTELRTRPLQDGDPLLLLASRRHRGERLGNCLEWLQSQWQPIERRNSGSALKFCQMVDGQGDFYPRFVPCCEWDTAAGQALLEGAGGALLGLDGKPLRYNRRESLYSPNFYGISDVSHPLWQALFARDRF